MKWGKKYDADYMNRLYNGIKKNMTKPFKLYCITDIPEGLNPDIKVIKLETKFSGWMKKSILFDEKILNQIEGINENSLISISISQIILIILFVLYCSVLHNWLITSLWKLYGVNPLYVLKSLTTKIKP